MKKTILKITLVAVIILIAGFNMYNYQKEELVLSDLMLENIEALAQSETGNGSTSGTCGWSSGSYTRCNISKWEAEGLHEAYGGYWCCDSCSSTSYCG